MEFAQSISSVKYLLFKTSNVIIIFRSSLDILGLECFEGIGEGTNP
jgi:hypothetical protein